MIRDLLLLHTTITAPALLLGIAKTKALAESLLSATKCSAFPKLLRPLNVSTKVTRLTLRSSGKLPSSLEDGRISVSADLKCFAQIIRGIELWVELALRTLLCSTLSSVFKVVPN